MNKLDFMYIFVIIISLTVMFFQYSDNTDGFVKPVIFEVEASNITEADKLYKEAFGKDVIKQANIGCTLIKNFSFEPHNLNVKLFNEPTNEVFKEQQSYTIWNVQLISWFINKFNL